MNNIIHLLVGSDDQSEERNADDIKRYLPRQLGDLQSAVKSCLTKSQEMHDGFSNLLDLAMEVHESCTATQGSNEAHIRDATMRQKVLREQKLAETEVKELRKKQSEQAQQAYKEVRDVARLHGVLY